MTLNVGREGVSATSHLGECNNFDEILGVGEFNWQYTRLVGKDTGQGCSYETLHGYWKLSLKCHLSFRIECCKLLNKSSALWSDKER